MANELTVKKNAIVVYQPNETLRLDVSVENETVWLTQAQMVKRFERDQSVIARHIRNAFKEGEVSRESNMHFLHNAISDKPVQCYDLDVIISVGYRVKSLRGTQFRRWATQVLKDHLLKGYSVNARLNQLEAKVDRRLAKHDQDIVELKEKVDFFVQTSLPPVQGVFFNGQVFDAHVFAAKYILNARKSILLIDSWVDLATLELLSKKNKGVSVEIVTSPRGNKLKTSDINAFNTQYGGLTVKTSKNFHDRFLVIDNKRLFLFGASLKDLGWKCFAFTELNASAIPELKARV